MAWREPAAWHVAAAAVVVGGVVGLAGTALRTVLTPWRIGAAAPELPEIPASAPRVEVAKTRHEFGTIGAGTSASHRFEVRNVGGGPLTLTRGTTSCSCTVSEFGIADPDGSADTTVVPPGESTLVTLNWKGKPPGGFVRHRATIRTDDPRRPEVAFVVEGMVVPTWRAEPASIALPRLSASTGQQASVSVFTYGREPPRIEAIAIDDPDDARLFTVSTATLSPERIAAEPGATGGFRIDLEVAPGLPPGPLRQTLTARFAIPEEVTAEVPVEGVVRGDLVVAGPGWIASRQRLELGTVSGRLGLRTTIFLTVTGPDRETVRPVVEERVPAALEVNVGAGSPVGSGAVWRIPIEIVIPPGSGPVNHICSDQAPAGRIVLATGRPEEPTLTIPVCVAIGP